MIWNKKYPKYIINIVIIRPRNVPKGRLIEYKFIYYIGFYSHIRHNIVRDIFLDIILCGIYF